MSPRLANLAFLLCFALSIICAGCAPKTVEPQPPVVEEEEKFYSSADEEPIEVSAQAETAPAVLERRARRARKRRARAAAAAGVLKRKKRK